MLTKCISVSILVITVQFSQIFAAPRDNFIQDGAFEPAHQIAESVVQDQLKPQGEVPQDISSMQTEVADSVLPDQPESLIPEGEVPQDSPFMQTETFPVEKNDAVPSDAANEEQYSHLLTKQEEFNVLKKIPEFTVVMRSLELLPDGIFQELDQFLENTVYRMPEGNPITLHFRNAQAMMQLFKRLFKIATAEGAYSEAELKAIFEVIHKAMPVLKSEIEQFNGIMQKIQNAQATLPNGGARVEGPPSAGDEAVEGASQTVNQNGASFAEEFDLGN